MMVSHQVTDPAAWREAFAAGEPVRRRHGAVAVRLLRDETGVVGLIDFPDDVSARAFLADPDLAPIPGVAGRPEVRILGDALLA